MNKVVVLVVTLVLTAINLTGAGEASYRGKTLWGISSEKIAAKAVPELANDARQTGNVLRVTIVSPGAAGEAEGIKAGDYLLSLNGEPADTFDISNVSGSRGGKIEVGDTLTAEVLKLRDGKPIFETLKIAIRPYYETRRVEYVERRGATLFSGAAAASQHWKSFEAVAATNTNAEAPLMKHLPDFLWRLERTDWYRDAYRLPIYGYLIRNPFAIEAVSRGIVNQLKNSGCNPVALLDTAQFILSFEPQNNSKTGPDSGRVSDPSDLEAHLNYVAGVLDKAAKLNALAMTKVSAEEQAFALANREAFIESFIEYKMLTYDPDVKRVKRSLEVLKILNKSDQNAFFAQAETIALLLDDRFIASLKSAAHTAELKKLAATANDGEAGFWNRIVRFFRLGQAEVKVPLNSIIAERDTPYGKIVIGGSNNNVYNTDFAVIFELGGNDLYLANQAGSVPGKIPSAVIIDYAGNDAYESTEPLTQGGGNFGVGLLRDLEGNDQYIGINLVQGSSFGGIGMLIDNAGNDTYRAINLGQGTGFFGAGILCDAAGDDRYEAHQTSQAVGLVGGTGLLSDRGGNDQYYCKGSQLTGYNTRGNFEGWGQGMGFGVRPYASGGVGVLYDRTGRDRFDAGTFGQGGGYYYAYGIFYNDGKDDDRYIGTHYAQGFGVHQALGAFFEQGGNDFYQSRNGVAQGLAWDEGVGLFIEESGDDSYDGGSSFSLGATAHNALCLFLDKAGKDHYAGCDVALVYGNDYHGGTSLSIFIDDGGAADTYLKRSNNKVETNKADSVFIDR